MSDFVWRGCRPQHPLDGPLIRSVWSLPSNLILFLYDARTLITLMFWALFAKTALCANRRRTLKYVKLSRRDVVARMCIQKELKDKALSFPKTFLTK